MLRLENYPQSPVTREFKINKMKTTKLVSTLAIASAVLFGACHKSDPAPATTNPVVIPVQAANPALVSLGTSSTIAVLAGSSVTSTGATNITGDLALSPGTSVGGFPPG